MKIRLALLSAGLCLTLFGQASAQTNMPAQTTPDTSAASSATGTVVSSSSTSLVIRMDNGTERTFVVDSASSVPTGLAAGQRVSVRFHNLDGGRYHAASVSTLGATTDTGAGTTSGTRSDSGTDATGTGTTYDDPTRRTDTATDRTDTTTGAGTDTGAGGALPNTASELPLLALAGVIALALAALLRGRAPRSV